MFRAVNTCRNAFTSAAAVMEAYQITSICVKHSDNKSVNLHKSMMIHLSQCIIDFFCKEQVLK